MANRRPTQAQIRDRRSKIAAVVLSIAFLGVAAIQGPKLLKMINGGGSSSAAASDSSTTTTDTTAVAGTPLPGATTTAAVVAVAASAGPGQLNRFSLFPVQVPFKPKPKPPVSATTKAAAAAAAAPKTATTGAATVPKTTPATTTTTPLVTAPATSTPVQPATTAAPPVTFTVPNGVAAAVVTVNGKKQLFGAGAMFPQEAPLFKLAAIAKKGLRITVLGGSFLGGQPYLVLGQGNKVTLLNQSDGTKFVIKYVKKTFASADQLTSPTQTTASPASPGTVPAAPQTTTH